MREQGTEISPLVSSYGEGVSHFAQGRVISEALDELLQVLKKPYSNQLKSVLILSLMSKFFLG